MLRLEVERKKRGWNKLQAAINAKLHPSTYGMLESGKLYPFPGYVCKLETLFGVDGKLLFQEVAENEASTGV